MGSDFLRQGSCVHAKSIQPCPTRLSAVALQAPLSMGILQARILEWVAMSSSRGIFPTQRSNLRLLTSPALADGFYFLAVQES